MIYLRHKTNGHVHGFPVESLNDLSKEIQGLYQPATAEEFRADVSQYQASLASVSWGETAQPQVVKVSDDVELILEGQPVVDADTAETQTGR